MLNEDRDHCLKVTVKGGETIALVGSAYLQLRGGPGSRKDVTYRPGGWTYITYVISLPDEHKYVVGWRDKEGAEWEDNVWFDGVLTIQHNYRAQYWRPVVSKFEPGTWVKCENAGSIDAAKDAEMSKRSREDCKFFNSVSLQDRPGDLGKYGTWCDTRATQISECSVGCPRYGWRDDAAKEAADATDRHA